MTTHRRGTRVEIARTVDPAGRVAVLLQVDDDWHLVLQPHDAIDLAESMTAIARGILTERN
ncbi:MAG TPA: hypothetical protein VH395_14375 [Jatrophihabitantaceae bacterium]|jgi:hypothetical protein